VAFVEHMGFVSVFRKAKQRAFYGKWTESFYSYDVSLYNDYTAKSSLSYIDQSALVDSYQIIQQEPSVSNAVLFYYVAMYMC